MTDTILDKLETSYLFQKLSVAGQRRNAICFASTCSKLQMHVVNNIVDVVMVQLQIYVASPYESVLRGGHDQGFFVNNISGYAKFPMTCFF